MGIFIIKASPVALKMKERFPLCHVSCWKPTRVVSTRTVVPVESVSKDFVRRRVCWEKCDRKT
jgi:hypothetical protein